MSRLTKAVFEDRQKLEQSLVDKKLENFFVFLVEDLEFATAVNDVHYWPKVFVIDSSAVIIYQQKVVNNSN